MTRKASLHLVAILAVLQVCIMPAFSGSAPAVSTGAGAGVGITEVVLCGELTAGAPAYAWFNWGVAEQGQEPGTTNNTSEALIADTNYFKERITGLEADTVYAYRFCASNESGAAASAWVWFGTYPSNFVTTTDLALCGGGNDDGFDAVRGSGAPDSPQVNNAVGATNVTDTFAFLTGVLVSTGSAPAQVWVFWALEDGGKDVSAWMAAGGAGNHEFVNPVLLTLLSHEIAVVANATYYYRFFATNDVGQTGWALETATFLSPAPPAVSTGPGAGVGITTAGLHVELISGIDAQVWLDWGVAESGNVPGDLDTIDLGVRTVVGTPEVPNPYRHRLEDLTASTGYAYRIRAENEYGSAESPWVWFTTYSRNFKTTDDTAWFGGGSYDGYDRQNAFEILTRLLRGTLLNVR